MNQQGSRPSNETQFARWDAELRGRAEGIVSSIKAFEETRATANADLNYTHFEPADFSGCTGATLGESLANMAKLPDLPDLTTQGDITGGPDDTVEPDLTDEETQEKAEKAKQNLQELFMPALPSVDDVVAKTMKVCEDVGIEDPVERGAIFRTLAGRHNL